MALDSERLLLDTSSLSIDGAAPWSPTCPSLFDDESNTEQEDEEELLGPQACFQHSHVLYQTPQRDFPAALRPKLKTLARFGEDEHSELQDAPDTENRASLTRKPEHRTGFTTTRRKRNAEDTDSSEGDEARLKKRRPVRNEPRIAFACPFMKADVARHHGCLRFRLLRIADVRQHLARKHKCPIHCPRCGDTFPTVLDRDQHIRARICETKFFTFEGMTEAQFDELTRSSRSYRTTSTDEERWYQMWHILFPGRRRPATPYIQNPDLVILQEFSNHTAALIPTMINDRLSSGAPASQNFELADIREIVTQSLNQSLRQFSATWFGDSASGDFSIAQSAPYSLPEDHSSNTDRDNRELLGIGDIQASTEPMEYRGIETLEAHGTPPRRISNSEMILIMEPREVPSIVAQSPPAEPLNLEDKPSNTSIERGRSTNDIWEEHKGSIQRLYIEENKPLNEVMAIMEDEHGFKAS
ncbi:hypothetical protein F4820DRAFT_415525 [Hypoxylon rubiginosum]|uniref:Uncharacterized protein n=1 Tax=Hypoxylon rubiginosum TaxID=110542 RepID=A0ACB9Z583_9PEZI|nr:hypothetical protein F4820DRAFT_415525 [Hypoxylon rubiginosum]